LDRSTVVIGAGPAGLTAAYVLAKESVPVVVLEADPTDVGGLSRTVERDGYRFDIGGHRFFSKSQEIEDLWTEILGSDLVERPRLSRIYYKGRFFAYPLRGGNVLRNLGVVESARSLLSYAKARFRPIAEPRSFEDWVTNRFGARLYRTFFKTYTEKVWGMSCSEISADWAAQRIHGLSLSSAIAQAVLPRRRRRNRHDTIKTLVDTFRYPRLGPGMLWQACSDEIRRRGGQVLLGRRVTRCTYDAERECWEVEAVCADGRREVFTARNVINSAPMADLPRMLEPPLPQNARDAASSLGYRDFITVALVVADGSRFPDMWIYIHDPSVKVGRVQNFKSWSPDMVPDPSMACYGLEYFCFENDGLWSSSDAELIELATRELVQIGLARRDDVRTGYVVRQRRAYPVYDDAYTGRVATIRRAIAESYPGLHLVGRNGMHKYNNQDHSMMTAILTARNILAGRRLFDVWQVNQDAEYHESGMTPIAGGRLVPARIATGSAR
jgi:protoporphyrinogen oxidase